MIYSPADQLTSATLGIGVDESGILPGLREASVVEKDVSLLELFLWGDNGNMLVFEQRGTEGKNACRTHLSKLSFLGVLLDGSSIFVSGDLKLLSV